MIHFSHIDTDSNRFCYKIDQNKFLTSLLNWAQQFDLLAYFDSNGYYNSHRKSSYYYHKYNSLFGVKFHDNEPLTFKDIKSEKTKNDWLMSYLSYDLKNEFHNLESNNFDALKFDSSFVFVPDIVAYEINNQFFLESLQKLDLPKFKKDISNFHKNKLSKSKNKKIESRYTKVEYIDTVNKIKNHIQIGDIYELNFCQEFYIKNSPIAPWETYQKLKSVSPTPFSAFFKQTNRYLISASPERYLLKKKSKIISQPIKGTIRKSTNLEEDSELRQELKNNIKERAENIMIVDLVRNDLSQTAKKGSVKVEELCGIYSFKQLHQMISTITANIKSNKSNYDLIESSFPMGSMTGAPKIKAMELIEKYEKTKRGLYSGSVGYFSPNGDFDFNVVIRSILHNSTNQYTSFTVGSAITIGSDAEKEYDECLLKAKAIRQVL